LCITSTFFISGGREVNDRLENVGGAIPAQRPVNPATTTTFPAPSGDSVKK
jgi:preprotein translocase subunit SecG